MKLPFSLALFFLGLSSVEVAEAEDAIRPRSPTVILDSRRDRDSSTAVEVVSGQKTLSGEPHVNDRRAYRNWDQACRSWKRELRQLNRGRVIIHDCGPARVKTEKRGDQSLYRYESQAEYKIRVN
ncbi:MAG: hypothetical protein EA369_04400 [Bradymonadales bacterium]|nr:MAG: hypothetical protein EA369_04400 [Bradymonadales bacterium]